VITDIHANLPALEASLEAINAIAVDALSWAGIWSPTAGIPTRCAG
jgi:hypothetical protein